MSATLFIILNLTDAYLTKAALLMGAAELNPLITQIGSSIVVKGLLAAAIVFILCYFRKDRVLWPLNILFVGVILWNLAVCGVLTLRSCFVF